MPLNKEIKLGIVQVIDHAAKCNMHKPESVRKNETQKII